VLGSIKYAVGIPASVFDSGCPHCITGRAMNHEATEAETFTQGICVAESDDIYEEQIWQI